MRAEDVGKYLQSPVVLNRRTEAGTVITGNVLEDPMIFDDLINVGLLDIKGALTIGEVLGVRLKRNCDSLTALKADMLNIENQSFVSDSNRRSRQIFISYSKHDRGLAEQICRELEKRDVFCWIAPRNIDVSEKWADQIVNAIEDNPGFIIILSDDSLQSDEVLKELTLASEMKKRIFAICVNGCEPTKGYRYHLSIAQRMNLYSGGIQEVIENIVCTINGTGRVGTKSEEIDNVRIEKSNHPVREIVAEDELQIVTYQELTRGRGLNKSEIARQLVANDRKLYPHIADDNEGDVSQWEMYLSKYPQTFRYMVNSQNEIVGNWSMVSISGVDYRRAKEGKLLESELNIENTEYFMFGGIFYGYLLNLSVNEEEMSPTNIRRLFDSFLDQLEEFAEKDIFFKSWCVNVFLEDHAKRYETLGFTYACDNIKTGKIYTLDLWPYPKNSIFKKRKNLKRLYENKFAVTCRQLDNEEMPDDDELETIAGLIYETDPYVYPAMFGTKDNAIELIPELIKGKDAMFNLDNLFVAEYDDEIVGLLLWIRGSLDWSIEEFQKVAVKCRVPVSEYLNVVTEKYINTYRNKKDKESISIINFCIAEEQRGIGAGSQLMEQFVKEHRRESVELCVLEENPAAVRLYQKSGFREVERYQGFSIDDKELVCIGMKLEK